MDENFSESIRGLTRILSGVGLGLFGMWLVVQNGFLFFGGVFAGVFLVSAVYTSSIVWFVDDEVLISLDLSGFLKLVSNIVIRLAVVSVLVLLFALVSTIVMGSRISIPYDVAVISLGLYFVSDFIRAYFDVAYSDKYRESDGEGGEVEKNTGE